MRANWNAEIEWQAARVVESKPAAEGGLQSLVLDIGALASGYHIPGQFVQIKVGDSKPGFYAIASPPDANNQGCIELLIKSVPGTTSELLAASTAGLEVSVSPVMGKGFNLNAVPVAEVDTLLLFATGTGIAPIRALLLSERLQTSERKDVRLYYGTVAPESTAYQADVAAWKDLNVEVVNVYSNGEGYYVQDAFAKGPPLAEGAVAGALVIGQKEMFQAVSEQLALAGVPSERILTNF